MHKAKTVSFHPSPPPPFSFFNFPFLYRAFCSFGYKNNNCTNAKLLQIRIVCCKIAVPVMPLHDTPWAGLSWSRAVSFCGGLEMQKSTGMLLLSKYVGVRQVGRTCDTTLGTPEPLALQWDRPCIWLCCSLNPFSGMTLLFLSIFRARQEAHVF